MSKYRTINIKYGELKTNEIIENKLRNDSLFGNKNSKYDGDENFPAIHSIIADDLPALLCRFKKDGSIIFANKAYAKFFGMTKEDIAGSKFHYSTDEFENIDSSKPFLNQYKKQFSLKLNESKIHWIEWTINRIADKTADGFEYQAIGQDITEYKLLEEQLGKILVAVEQSSSTVVITDTNGNIEYVNPRFTDVTGYTFEEAKGKNTRILNAGYTNAEIYSGLWNTITAGKEWQGELLNKKKNGDLFWELVTISPVKNKDGIVKNYIAVKEDITEHKKAEALQDAVYKISHALIENDNLEQLYPSIHKSLASVLPVENFFIAMYDKGNNLLSFPYFVDEFDEPYKTESPGRGLTEYVLRTGKPLHADPEIFRALVENGEVDLVGTDSLDWIGVPLIINGSTIGVIVAQSYSEKIRLSERELDILIYVSNQIALAIQRIKTLALLKSSEERFRLLFDKAADLIAIIDPKGFILDLNNIFEIETGYRRSEIIGQNIFTAGLLTSKSVITAAFYFSKIILGKEIPIIEVEGVGKDGNIILYEVRAVPIIEKGKQVAIQAILRNVSERKKTENKLSQSERHLTNLMANLPGMAYRCKYDENWTMEFVSQGCHELTGYFPEELIQNKEISYADLILEKDKENVDKTIKASISKNLSFQFVYRIKSKEGKEKWVWEKGNAIISKRGKVEALEGFITDISNRIHAEHALKESEELYRKLIATLPDIIAITDIEGNIIFLNEVGIKFSGYSNFEEVKRKNFINFIADEDKEKVNRNFKLALQKSVGAQEFKFINTKGDNFLFEVQREILLSSDGAPYGHIFSCRDITFRKKIELAVAQSEEQYRTLVDSIQDGVFLIQDGNISFVNQAFSEMIGYDVSEIVGNSFTKFVAPEDINVVARNYERRQEGEIFPPHIERRMLHKNGSRVYVNVNARVIHYQGGKATIGTLKDVTKEMKMQEVLLSQKNLFKGIAEVSNILLTEKDFDLAITSTLRSLGESTKVNRVYIFENSKDSVTDENIINQRYEWTSGSVSAEINNPDLQNLRYEPLLFGWYDTLNSGNVITGLVKDFNDSLRTFLEEENIKSILLVPIMVRDQFWGFIGFDDCSSERIWKDEEVSILKATAANLGGVIEKEMSKQELIEAKNTAEEMNRLKSNFLANMSHELRTPLIAILGYAEILQAEVEKLEWTEMVDTISQSGKRLLETLNLILDLSKIESDKVQINYKKINLADEVIEIINLLNPVAVKKGLSLSVDIKEKEIMANIDKRLFHSVLSNLLHNGIKYTNEGSIKVELSNVISNEKSFALIKVSDTGIGISKEDQKIIFDEFRQVSQGYNRNYEGAGLGLSITKKFIEKMGGQISVDSETGKGSMFTVLFPIENDIKLKEESDPKTNNDKPGAHSFSQNKNRALVIDDDPASRRIMSLFLKNELQIDSASTSEEAISFINSNHYSLVFMDISLGKGTNGVDLMKTLRKINGCSDTPIIAVTAHAMMGDKEKFLSSGFNDYLSKPFSKNDLLHKTLNWVNSPINNS